MQQDEPRVRFTPLREPRCCSSPTNRSPYKTSRVECPFTIFLITSKLYRSRIAAGAKQNLVELTQCEITFAPAFDLDCAKGMLFSKNMQIR